MRKSIYTTIIILLTSLLTVSLQENLKAQTYKILPLGNSITQADASSEGANSYRRNLWNKLINDGYDVDFVGSTSTDKDGNPFPDGSFDHDHEGHWGYRADEIVGELPGWLTGYDPDVALIHIGSNDAYQGYSVASTIADIEEIIDILRTDNASITIFLAQLIPLPDPDDNDTIDAINAELLNVASSKYQAGSRVIIVDQNSGWNIWTHTYDGVHPNEAGEEVMAQKWFDAYMDAIPEVPAEFALSGATSTSIDLSWVDNSSNESGFEIERSLTSSDEDFSNIHTVPAGTTTYTDMGLDSDIEYFYRIRAVNSTGASLYTSVESTTTLPAPPAAPTGLSATAIDENTIDLSWTDTNNENNYIIERSFTSGSGFTVIDTISANSTSYRDGTLTEDTRYYYRIYATNPGGDSDYSNEASAITDPSVPDAPSNMTFTDVKETSMRVRWEDNSDNEDNFVLERRESASDSWGVIAEPTNNYYDDSGLEDNTTYYYQVKAVNAAGFSDYTSGSQTTLLAKPAAPFDFEGIANNTCTVDLTWQDTAHNEDGFELWKRIGSTGTYELLETLPPDTQSYIDTDTENETTYGYRIHAFNDAGTSEYAFTTVNVNVVLDGGTIGYDQTICPEGDAELIQNVDSPSGGSGNWIYQWQSRTTGDFSDITGAEGISYDPPAGMTETTDYQRVSTTECGSVTSNSVTITVEDLEDPVFDLCPDDIVLEVERDQTTGEVDTPDPVATDNCGIELLTWSMTGATVASSPETGFNTVGLYTFNLGVTTVTYHVEDQSGNEAECSFTVTVEIKDPEVLDVTIPNNIMGIGQRVTVTITVAEDGGSEYDLISGTIGGYTLEDLTRENSTTYYTSFDIYEGGNSYPADQDIPVTNLVVTDGKEQSDPYNLPIVQPNDLLDAERPVIESMSVETGQKKIDDVVELNIDADGPDYTIDPASVINGISVDEPNMEFTDLDGGNYRLSYRVQEGDQDVGPGELTASIILVKPSGNSNEPYTVIGNVNNLTIDAHAPVVTRMEVPNEEVGVGGEVQVTVTADGTGYVADDGTTVNGVPLSSSTVTFSGQSENLYLLSYTVAQGDDNVAPGTLDVNLVLRDPAGNISPAYTNIESNSMEVYTELPTAVLAGTPEICEDEVAGMEVFLSGRSPWSLELYDGTGTVTYSDITDTTFEFEVTPEQTTTYSIPVVTDRNGVVNTGSGSVQVTVHEKTDVEFVNLATGYSVEAEPFPLEANVMGGTFSGTGVISSTGYFDPGLADTVDSPHTLYYTYTNEFGCTSVAEALVFVLGAEGDIYIPSGIVCDYSDPFEVSASNVAGVTGSFELLNESSQEVGGLTDNGDNTAVVDPSLLSAGSYTIEYEYFDQVTLYLRAGLTVESVDEPEFVSFSKTTFCQNDEPVQLISDSPQAVFSGPGVSGNSADGFIFDPSDANLGGNVITCTVNTENGCSNSTTREVQVKFAPELRFALSTRCLPVGGGNVAFNNLTGGKLMVESWSWDFGDINSGENNYSDLIDPVHFYQMPGERTIRLTATTTEGCVSTLEVDTTFGGEPVSDFTWVSDCFTSGSAIEFISKSVSGFEQIDTLVYTFRTPGGGILGEIGTGSLSDTVRFPFASDGNFEVDLYTLNEGGCGDTATRAITLRPTIVLDEEGYLEAFNMSEGKWTMESADERNSWVWDVPDFDGFEPTTGDKAWYTDLPEGSPGYLEHSWIQSPCFDFSDIERPLIQLDIMRSFAPTLNGSVLQYRDVVDEGWKTIGATTPGITWYNVYDIYHQPGGSSIGWGLDVFKPDTDWLRATHDLDQVAGNPRVVFRLAVATNGEQAIGNQGFAFDNVTIAERTKLSVLEHFTNSSDIASKGADDLVDAFGAGNRDEVIDLQYHTDYPGTDPMNENNPDPASTRSGTLGVGQVPYAVMDGGVTPATRYDFSGEEQEPDQDALKLLSLEIPLFEVDLEVDWLDGGLLETTTVTCRTDGFDENIQLYVVVFESSVTAYTGENGDTEFRNVVLGMLPTPAGKLLGNSWYEGKTDTRSNTWTYPDYVEDTDDLGVVAFIQERSTGRILQADVAYKSPQVGIGNGLRNPMNLLIYPNPVQERLFINTETPDSEPGVFRVIDISGKTVMIEEIKPGSQIHTLDVKHLNRGMYIIHWLDSGMPVGRGKFIKTE